MTVPLKAGDEEEDDWGYDAIPEPNYPAVPTVDYTPPEIVAVLYDVNGEPLIEIEAPRNPIGFG